MDKNLHDFLTSQESELFDLIKNITLIPAPSYKEKKRAEYIKNYLEENGAKGVYIDEVYNVIYPVNIDGSNDITLFLTHIDTVFPDESPMPYIDDGEYIHSPGVIDNVVCVAQMLTVCKYIANNLNDGYKNMLFVFNSCEEGLGNLRGTRAIFESFKNRISLAYSFDSGYNKLVAKAVGSVRFKVTVKTEGGHSFNAFGNKNAIAVASKLISSFYEITPPVLPDSKTTYNVGVINGGTSVNTIAQQVEFLCEYRSDNADGMEIMRQNFEKAINTAKSENGVEILVEIVGERPCGKNFDQSVMQSIIDNAMEICKKHTGIDCKLDSGSTDCNIPLSLGIPSICVGSYLGSGAHTREEKLLKSSVMKGLNIVVEIITKKQV